MTGFQRLLHARTDFSADETISIDFLQVLPNLRNLKGRKSKEEENRSQCFLERGSDDSRLETVVTARFWKGRLFEGIRKKVELVRVEAFPGLEGGLSSSLDSLALALPRTWEVLEWEEGFEELVREVEGKEVDRFGVVAR